MGLVLVALSLRSDIYWIAAWAILALIPAIMWVDRTWSRWSVPALTAIAALAGIATTIRGFVGVPLVLAILLALGFRAPWRIASRLAAAAVVIGAFALTSSVLVSQVVSYRDHHAPVSARAPEIPAGHGVWHNVYIGLGYLPNDRGIWSNDDVGIAAVRARDPKAVLASRRYERTLRTLTLDIVRDDPAAFARLEGKKAAVLILWGAVILLALIATLPWAWRRDRDRIGLLLMLTAPALVILAIPPLATVPLLQYALGWLAALALIALFTISLAIARAIDLLADGASLSAHVPSGAAETPSGLVRRTRRGYGGDRDLRAAHRSHRDRLGDPSAGTAGGVVTGGQSPRSAA